MASADKYQALLYEPTSSWAHVHKSYFLSTVFENHRKSLIHNASDASKVYILRGQKLIKNAQNGPKIEQLKCDILSNFQTVCLTKECCGAQWGLKKKQETSKHRPQIPD